VVLVVTNGHAERRAVSVSASSADEAVVSAGLAAGERVIVQGPAELRDGASVKETSRAKEAPLP